MKKRCVLGFVLSIIFIVVIGLSGCQSKHDADINIDVVGSYPSDPRHPMPHLAFKADKRTFDIGDVTLTFYCGSENAGEHGIYHYTDCPTVTYIYFADANTYSRKDKYFNSELDKEITFGYVEGLAPKDLYNIIETNEHFSVCKKILSTDSDAFYKNNTVKRKYKDISTVENRYAREDEWGRGSALYKVSSAYSEGLLIPDVAYTFTIPETFFAESEGYVFFCVSSYYSENYEAPNDESSQVGDLLEHRSIAIYYMRNGSDVTLSSYYNK